VASTGCPFKGTLRFAQLCRKEALGYRWAKQVRLRNLACMFLPC